MTHPPRRADAPVVSPAAESAGVLTPATAESRSVKRSVGTKPGYSAPHGPHSCSRCATTWTGASACHCSGCCRTFAGVGLFDAHRSASGEHGDCLDPATLTVQTGPRAGEPVMFLRGGVWSGPEMTEEQKLAAFGTRS